MVETIDVGNPPAGYALTSARKDEFVDVVFREFTSTEDGQYFIQRLEELPNEILGRMRSKVMPSQVDHLLAIYRRDGTATIYLNELEIIAQARAARPVEAGQAVTKSDVADIESLELGVEIPDDAGFFFIFSIGWRKGLFYDFEPVIGKSPQTRQYDTSSALAQAYAHLIF